MALPPVAHGAVGHRRPAFHCCTCGLVAVYVLHVQACAPSPTITRRKLSEQHTAWLAGSAWPCVADVMASQAVFTTCLDGSGAKQAHTGSAAVHWVCHAQGQRTCVDAVWVGRKLGQRSHGGALVLPAAPPEPVQRPPGGHERRADCGDAEGAAGTSVRLQTVASLRGCCWPMAWHCRRLNSKMCCCKILHSWSVAVHLHCICVWGII